MGGFLPTLGGHFSWNLHNSSSFRRCIALANTYGLVLHIPLCLAERPFTTDIPSPIPAILNCVNEGPAGTDEHYLSFVCVIMFELSVFGVSVVCAVLLTTPIDVLLLTLWNLKINSICVYCPANTFTSTDIRRLGWRSRDKNPLIYAFHRDSNSCFFVYASGSSLAE